LICTLRSTVAFFSLFFSLDMAFLLLGIGYLHRDAMNMPNAPIIKAGGFFALLAAFLAWYNALAGIADDSNRSAIPSPIWRCRQTHPLGRLSALVKLDGETLTMYAIVSSLSR